MHERHDDLVNVQEGNVLVPEYKQSLGAVSLTACGFGTETFDVFGKRHCPPAKIFKEHWFDSRSVFNEEQGLHFGLKTSSCMVPHFK